MESLCTLCKASPCSVTDFKTQIAALFKNAVPTLLTPFNFCRLHYTERRNILLNLFAQNIAVDLADFEEIAEDLEKFSPEQIIKSNTYERKQIEKELATIPARIDELQKSIVTVDTAAINAEIDELNKKIAVKLDEVKKRQAASKQKLAIYNQSVKFDSDARKLEDAISEWRAEYRSNEIELNQLRNEYSELQKATTGTCPTCGSKIPATNIAKVKARLNDIIARGKEISSIQQEALKKSAETAQKQADELRQKAAELKKQYEEEIANFETFDELNAALAERDELQAKLSQLKLQLTENGHNAEKQKRIEELKARETELADDLANYDKKIYLASNYISRRIELTEQTINDQFQFVQFKMFGDYKTVDGVKECCEPTLNGVPYAALSKGEQLKASLDILNALQKAYGVELPVFIDDAESYTSNSFVNIPNQVVRCIAKEGVKKLKIRVTEKVMENEGLFEGSLTA